MATASHSRKISSRAALPRRTTKGPLDAPEDPLAVPPAASQQPLSPQNEASDPFARVPTPQRPVMSRQEKAPAVESAPSEEQRDLSFLLDSSIYHALSQVEVPGPFRKPLLPPPDQQQSLNTVLQQLNSLLSACDFLRAAQLAGSILISGIVRPTDAKTIFRLLEIRYSCLELSGNSLMAAQEAKALEDLSSDFYYDDDIGPEKEAEEEALDGRPRKLPQHIMGFSLRLQALRLQSIGFADPRRGVSSLYDVGMECREHLSSSSKSPEQRKLWAERLREISIRVVNALIEMGDLDAAARTLQSLKPDKEENQALWLSRMVLLKIKAGDVSGAQRYLESPVLTPQTKPMLEAIFAIAEGRNDDAARILSDNKASAEPAVEALVRQNLAVAYLYRGEIRHARGLLEDLVVAGNSFQTLTINLATIFDLTSDKAQDLKASMISRIVGHQKDEDSQIRSYLNADFKL